MCSQSMLIISRLSILETLLNGTMMLEDTSEGGQIAKKNG